MRQTIDRLMRAMAGGNEAMAGWQSSNWLRAVVTDECLVALWYMTVR